MASEPPLSASLDAAGLLDQAESYAAAGDARAAVAFYRAALSALRSPPAEAALVERLRAAQLYLQDQSARFQQTLDRALAANPGGTPEEALRLDHMLAMLTGERSIYPQEPSVLYTPYLAQRQFWERSEFAWIEELEVAAPAIRAELVDLLECDIQFRPYVEESPDRPLRTERRMIDDPSWSALYLWRNSLRVEEVANRCPATMAALAKVPLSRIGRRTPSALFSQLAPGAHIPPHNGMLNCRVICHLPLIVPPGCTLRVGNETREWEEGKLLIFDDSIEHEARNPTSELRIVLLFDVWRPELATTERRAISAIFDAIDQFQGADDG